MQSFPKWATPERRLWLALQLAKATAKPLEWTVDMFSGEFKNAWYNKSLAMLKAEWQAEDRAERAYLRKLERESLHPKEYFRQGGFDSLMREIFLESQPGYYVEATGIDALRRQPIVKVRVASSPVRLLVDVPQPESEPRTECLPRMSKNAWRRAKRYGKGPLADAVRQAVTEYRNS